MGHMCEASNLVVHAYFPLGKLAICDKAFAHITFDLLFWRWSWPLEGCLEFSPALHAVMY
jgi:hypothetical protein